MLLLLHIVNKNTYSVTKKIVRQIFLTKAAGIAMLNCEFGGVAQLARALEWHSRGQGFNSPYLHLLSR